MSITKTINGTDYEIPERKEKRWGAQGTAYLSALGDAVALLLGGPSGSPVLAFSVATNTLAASASLTATKPIHRLTGSGGPISLDGVTPIVAGVQGQILILTGAHATDFVTILDSGTVDLNGDVTLELGRSIFLIYNSTRAVWEELFRTQ